MQCDGGVSGSVPLAERPEGKRLLEAVEKGDVIITAKLDRAFRSAADALGTLGRKRSQALAQGHVVYSAGRCRIRRPHGGCARPLCRSVRSEAPGRLFRREPDPTHRRVRQPIPAEPGQIERYDCEYKRNGTANLFIFLDVHRPWRKVKVSDSRAAVDFAVCMRELTDVHFPKAECIRDRPGQSVDALGGRASTTPLPLVKRGGCCAGLEFHYVPKHASWLNMVEIEIGVLRSQCPDRRIASHEHLISEIGAWERQRNASGARIKWMFTTAKARAKMGRAYPEPAALREPQIKKS